MSFCPLPGAGFWRRALLGCLAISASLVISASYPVMASATTDEGAPPADTAGVPDRALGAVYVPLQPAFVVNYGGPAAGRLRYLKADIAVRLANNEAASALRHHMPYVRNNLVLLFSAQTDDSLASQEGREALRQEALREVREVLLREERKEGVVDLYFNNFLVQN